MSAPVAPASVWSVPVRVADVDRKDQRLELAADADARLRIARLLGLSRLDRFDSMVRLSSWLDGVEIKADWSADLEQTCGLTLEPLPASLKGRFHLRLLPTDSPNAPADGPEAVVDPEAEDPPDLFEGDVLNVADYLVEHLALELDPFPRKPGAVFEPPPETAVITPFAALKGLAKSKDAEGGDDPAG